MEDHMPRQRPSRRTPTAQPSATLDHTLDPRIKMASRALTVGVALAPVAMRLWRWRTAIRIAISLLLVGIPLILRIRALRSTPPPEHLAAPYRLPRARVLEDSELDIEASAAPVRE
jgi:hypothetical protein